MSTDQRRQPKGAPASIGGQWAADADRASTSIDAGVHEPSRVRGQGRSVRYELAGDTAAICRGLRPEAVALRVSRGADWVGLELADEDGSTWLIPVGADRKAIGDNVDLLTTLERVSATEDCIFEPDGEHQSLSLERDWTHDRAIAMQREAEQCIDVLATIAPDRAYDVTLGRLGALQDAAFPTARLEGERLIDPYNGERVDQVQVLAHEEAAASWDLDEIAEADADDFLHGDRSYEGTVATFVISSASGRPIRLPEGLIGAEA